MQERLLLRLILVIDSHEILTDVIILRMQELLLIALESVALDLAFKVDTALSQGTVLL